MIIAIAAVDNKHGIAADQEIPWDIPQDRAYFRSKTKNHKVVMGYKTYQSMKRPLVGRQCLVLTSHDDLPDGFTPLRSIDKIVNLSEDVYIIGGQQVYEAFLEYTELIILTRVNADFGCDRFFPEYEDGFSRVFKSKQYKSADNLFWYEHWKRAVNG